MLGAQQARYIAPLQVALVTLLAFALRIANLENAVHLFVDEMHFVEGVTRIWDNPGVSPFGPMASDIAAFPMLYAYLQSASVAVFGPNLTGMRFISVIFGTLTVPAVYLLVRAHHSYKIALLAALVLATFPPHIHFSRSAMNNIADPLFGTLALAFLAWGLRRKRWPDFLLAGFTLGLTQYFYEGGKLVFPVVVLGWLLIAWLRGRVDWRRALIVPGAALLLTLPIAQAYNAAGFSYTPRLDAMRLNEGDLARVLLAPDGLEQINGYLQAQFYPPLLHLFWSPDGSGFYYGGYTALILPYLVPIFFIGLGMLLWRQRWELPTLILLVIAGNSLLTDSDWSARFVVLLPALAIMIAIGLYAIWSWVVARWPGAGVRRLAIAITVILLAGQVIYYFGPHLRVHNQQIRPHRDHQDMVWRAREFPPGTNVFLFSDEPVLLRHVQAMQRFWELDLNIRMMHPLFILMREPSRLPGGADLAFFVQPDNRELLNYLARAFDLPPPQYSPYNLPPEKQYALYYVAMP